MPNPGSAATRNLTASVCSACGACSSQRPAPWYRCSRGRRRCWPAPAAARGGTGRRAQSPTAWRGRIRPTAAAWSGSTRRASSRAGRCRARWWHRRRVRPARRPAPAGRWPRRPSGRTVADGANRSRIGRIELGGLCGRQRHASRAWPLRTIRTAGGSASRWVGRVVCSFDHIDQHLLMQRVRQHCADLRVNRVLVQFLKAGVLMSEEQFLRTDAGTPQGGIITPRTQKRTCRRTAFWRGCSGRWLASRGRTNEAHSVLSAGWRCCRCRR